MAPPIFAIWPPLFSVAALPAPMRSRSSKVWPNSPRSGAGVAVFDKNCAQCHACRDMATAWTNLVEFAGKSVEDFLLAILDPNSPSTEFPGLQCRDEDGRSLTGIVRGETASSLTLVQARRRGKNPAQRDPGDRASQLSLMPEGLEQAFTRRTRNLIAWLKK